MSKMYFDIGANRGDAVWNALQMGFDKVIAFDPAPRMFSLLAQNYLTDSRVIPLKLAVSDIDGQQIEFYECGNGQFNQGDGSSTMEIYWLTDPKSRVAGMGYRTVKAYTVTLDTLIEKYGMPELIKIDVEGGESKVIAGLSYKPKQLNFEWHLEFMDRHIEDVKKLANVNGYEYFAPQFITHHLLEPTEYYPISDIDSIYDWIDLNKESWESNGWIQAGGLNRSADVGMIWVK